MVAHDGDDLAKGMREREKTPEIETDLEKGGKREKKKKRRPNLVVARGGYL